MSETLQIVTVDLSTAAAGNTQDITISGFGTPAAMIIFVNTSSADDTVESDTRLSIGWTDGTRQNVCANLDQDNLATTNTERDQRTDAVYVAGGTSGRFSFNSWITDGVRLNIDQAVPAARKATVILLKSADIANVYVGSASLSTGANDITAPGFEPDLVLMTSTGNATAPPNTAVHSIFSFGVGVNDGADTQRAFLLSGVDASATSTNTTYLTDAGITGQAFNGALNWRGTISGYDSSGFTITPNVNPSSDYVFYIAVKFSASTNISLFDVTIPTTGNYAETSPGFLPEFGMLFGVAGPTALNTVTTANNYGAFVSAFDSNGIRTLSSASQDAQATSNSASYSSDSLKILDDDASTVSVVSSGYAFDADGWDFTLTTNPAVAVIGFGLAIGAAASGTTITPPVGSLSFTGYAPTATATANLSVSIPLGSMSLTGYAPSISTGADVSVDVPLGSMAITGHSPLVTAGNNISVSVPAGSMVLTGNTPDIQLGPFSISIPAGSMSMTGHAPSVSVGANTIVDIPIGSVAFTGYAPVATTTSNLSVPVPHGSISMTGYAPSLEYGPLAITVPVGTLSITGYAPSATIAGVVWTKQNDVSTTWSFQSGVSTIWTEQTDDSTPWTIQ